MKKHIDLHIHSIYSDGVHTPKALVVEAATIGLDAIAISDHDITDSWPELKEEADKWGLNVMTGVEISTPDYHILGYGFDIKNTDLQDALSFSRDIQEDTCKKRIEKLVGIGIPISFDMVRGYFPKSRLGKGNLFMTMLRDPGCRYFIHERQGMYDPAKIFLHYFGDNAAASHIDYLEELSPEEAIDLVHGAGGKAFLAHAFKDVKDMSEMDVLLGYGLDGLEVQPNYNGNNGPFKKYAKDNNILVSYGSDFHGLRLSHRPMLLRKGNAIEPFW